MQKVILTLLSFILLNSKLSAQVNLVPNPSFETYTSCPTTLGQMSYCQSWSSFSQSPDYFNTCAAPSCLAPPNNCEGYQQPVYGNAYAGFISWDYSSANYREIIGTQLISPLSIGIKYYFSFYVSFAGTTALTMATNKMGLRFSTIPYSISNPIPINNFAHYFCPTKITDSLNWTRLKGSFVADSVYKYIAFGNFFNDSNTDTMSTGLYNDQSYYFIDNVCLSTDSNLAYTISVQEINYKRNISVYPNPCVDMLTIKSSGGYPEKIELFDVLGRPCVTKNNNQKSSQFILDVSILNNGIYTLRLTFQNETIQKQIIISK